MNYDPAEVERLNKALLAIEAKEKEVLTQSFIVIIVVGVLLYFLLFGGWLE